MNFIWAAIQMDMQVWIAERSILRLKVQAHGFIRWRIRCSYYWYLRQNKTLVFDLFDVSIAKELFQMTRNIFLLSVIHIHFVTALFHSN